MRNPKISTKRVLGLALAAALAVGATVAVASSSQAVVAVTAATVTPATGSSTASTNLTVKGKGFQDLVGAVQVKAVKFSSAACTSTVATGTAAVSFNVVSATKAVVVSPVTLAAGSYYVCFLDAASGTTANILGQGTFKTGVAPTIVSLSTATGSSLGGTKVVVTGTNFDKTTKVSFDGVAASTTYVSATKVSTVAPAHAVGTAIAVKITSAYGIATSTAFAYVAAVVVSPVSGDGTVGNVITLTGVGFNAYTFVSAAGAGTVVAAVPGGATATTTPTNICTSVVVESDTSLSCQLPTLAGAYTIRLVTMTDATTATGSSSVSKAATYTAATF